MAALLATGGGRSEATHTKAPTSVCLVWHGALLYLCNCMKINDSPFLKHFAPGPQGIHFPHDAFGFSHLG